MKSGYQLHSKLRRRRNAAGNQMACNSAAIWFGNFSESTNCRAYREKAIPSIREPARNRPSLSSHSVQNGSRASSALRTRPLTGGIFSSCECLHSMAASKISGEPAMHANKSTLLVPNKRDNLIVPITKSSFAASARAILGSSACPAIIPHDHYRYLLHINFIRSPTNPPGAAVITVQLSTEAHLAGINFAYQRFVHTLYATHLLTRCRTLLADSKSALLMHLHDEP